MHSQVASQQVSWWSAHVFIEAVVQQANYPTIPDAGTPAWCALADDDPRKLLALAVAGDHHVLRVETAQQAAADASKAVASAADWPGVARSVGRRRCAAYIPRRSA
jgi:hypothetical protein